MALSTLPFSLSYWQKKLKAESWGDPWLWWTKEESLANLSLSVELLHSSPYGRVSLKLTYGQRRTTTNVADKVYILYGCGLIPLTHTSPSVQFLEQSLAIDGYWEKKRANPFGPNQLYILHYHLVNSVAR